MSVSLGRIGWRLLSWQRIKPHLAVLAFFTGITCLMTWPLVAHLGTSIAGAPADNFFFLWKMYWVKHALIDLHQTPWVAPDIYYPDGYLLAYGELSPLNTLLGLPVTLGFGETAGYNLFVLAATILSGYFTYLWIVTLTNNRIAGVLAGVLFAFCPYRLARISGHLNLVRTEGFPLFFMGVERFLQQHRRHNALLMALGFALVTLSSWYYGLILATTGAVYLLVRAHPLRLHVRERSFWVGSGIFAATIIFLVGPFLLPYKDLVRSGATHLSLAAADFWSGSLLDLLLPNIRHPIWGKSLQSLLPATHVQPIYEFVLGLGLTTVMLAWYGLRWSRVRARTALRWLVGTSLILSLGMTLHFVTALPISLPVPQALASIYNGCMDWFSRHISWLHEPFSLAQPSSISVPLPGLFLRWLVPGMAAMRAWTRFAVIASFGLASLGGLGLDAWYRREVLSKPVSAVFARRRLWVAGGIFMAIGLFEFWAGPQRLTPVEPRQVDQWLAQQPGQFAIMQYPIHSALNGQQMLYTRYHGKRLIFGYGVYLNSRFQQRYPELAGFPDEASLDTLARLDVPYVLLDLDEIPSLQWGLPGDIDPNVLAQIKEQPRLELVDTFDRIQVYRVKP